MKRKRYAAGLLAVVIIFVYAGNVRSEEKPVACVICHEYLDGALAGPVQEWRGSIHQQNGITCDLCHGGDPGVDLGNIRQLTPREFADRQSRAMAKSRGFIGKPSGRVMFDVCGKCHAGSVDRYANSIMGKAYLDDKGGPSCTVCHGAHRNAIPEVPKVCESCHSDTTGFDQIDAMNVTASTIGELSRIRIKLAEEKAKGRGPALLPEFPEDLGSFQIGFVAFGAVIVLFLIGFLVYGVLEKRR
ncbi:MAG: cytochrome c3 family protein [Nitrospirae bacterium]|nr:cytochrome c3 family protein [Nitrospirota bacterium]